MAKFIQVHSNKPKGEQYIQQNTNKTTQHTEQQLCTRRDEVNIVSFVFLSWPLLWGGGVS